MTASWRQTVQTILDGEQVRASVTNRPTQDLVDRTDYLKHLFDSLEAGQSLSLYGVPLAPGMPVGTPVYLDASQQRFDAAFTSFAADPATGVYAPGPSTLVLGLLRAKATDRIGDVVLFGFLPLDLTAPLGLPAGSSVPPGPCYLSSHAGRLTAGPVATGPLVCIADGTGGAFVVQGLRDFLDGHVHYSVELVCQPAGHVVPPPAGGRHTIAASDATLPGWLPAGHPVFAGQAPAGSVWGYNLSQHEALSLVWPPQPLSALSVTWDKGQDRQGGTVVPMGHDGLIIADRHGLWWTSDCYGDVPWPTNFDNTSSSEAGSATVCPRYEHMHLVVSFAKTAFGTDRSAVTSLHPRLNNPVKVAACASGDGVTGDLEVYFDGSFLVDPVAVPGFLALKGLKPDGQTFRQGAVVEALVPASDGSVVLQSAVTQVVGGVKQYQGVVMVQAVNEPGEKLLPVQVVRLSDVRERFFEEVMYLGFPVGQTSSVRVRLQVPTAALPLAPQVKLRFLILGPSAGTLPEFVLTYRLLPRPTGNPVTLPVVDTLLTLETGLTVGAEQYIEATAPGIAVHPGDILFFTLERLAGDGYADEVGVLDMTGVLVPST